MRIGTGFDVHKFGPLPVTHIRIGGVDIPHDREILAHSDGDVVIHALCDAILGSLALGDIGHHFPDNDSEFENIDSRVLLRHIRDLLAANHYRLSNADITLIAQVPRVAKHIEAMRTALSDDLETDLGNMSVKATTTEKLGFVGRGEGIAAEAVVLVEPIANSGSQ